MAKYTRIEVVLQMKENGIVPVFYNADLEVCKQVLKACYDGGLRTFEFTNRGDYAHEVFGELNKFAKAELDGMMMGVGLAILTLTLLVNLIPMMTGTKDKRTRMPAKPLKLRRSD